MRGDVILDLLARDSGGIESVAGLVDGVGEEGLVAFEEIVAIAVDEKIVVYLLFVSARAVRERLVNCQSLRIALSPEDAFEVLTGFDELSHHLDFARREARRVEGHLDGAEFGELRGEVFGGGGVGGAAWGQTMSEV